jgi:integrase
VRQRTYEGYEHMAERHIIPTLGCLKLKNLTPAHVRGLYRERLDSGLSPRTVQYVHSTLNKALKQAVADGLIPRNAATSVKAPRPRSTEIMPLDREQVRALFDAASDHQLGALYIVAATAGLRRGELLALRWKMSTSKAIPPWSMFAGRSQKPAAGASTRLPSPARAGRYDSPARPQKPSRATASARTRRNLRQARVGKITGSCFPPASARRWEAAI